MGRALIATVLLGALLLGGCSSDTESLQTTDRARGEPDAPARPDAAGPADEAADGDRAADAPAAEEPADDTALTVGASLGRELIRRAHLTLRSADPARTVQEIRGVVDRLGGFVSATELGRDDREVLSGSMTLRLPADSLEGALERLTALESVTGIDHQRLETEDVTGELTDLASELRNLRAVEAELRGLLTEIRRNTQSADQVLQLFSRIREVRSEIERLEGRRATLEDLVALATVHVEVVPDDDAVPPVQPDPWRPARIVGDALAATVTALQGLATALIWVGLTGLPVLALTAGPLAALVWWLRRGRRDSGPAAA